MRKAVVAAMFTILAPALAYSQAQVVSDTGRTVIVANGQAREPLVPDRVSVLVALEAQGMSSDDAATRLGVLERIVLDTLRKTVGKRGTVQSFGYGVSPYRSPNMPSSMVGGPAFVGRSIVRIDLEQIEDLNRVTSAAAAKGGSPTGSPTYTSTSAENSRRTAMAKAFEQARGDAAALAQAAGGKLGRLIEVSSINVTNPFPDNGQALFISQFSYDSGPRTPPSTSVSVNVTTRWELLR